MAQLHCSAAFVPCLFLSNCPQLTSDKVLKLQANLQREAEPLASSPTLVFWWQGAIAGGQRLAPYALGHLAELYGRREGLAALVLCFPSSLRCLYFPWAVLVFSVFTESICSWCLLGVQQAYGLTRHGVRRVKVKYKEMILYLGFYVGNGNGKPMSLFAPVARLFPRTSVLVVVLGFPPRALLDLLPVRSSRSHVCMLVEWFVFQLLRWSLAWCLQELQDFSCPWYFWASVEAWRCLLLYLLEGFFCNLWMALLSF